MELSRPGKGTTMPPENAFEPPSSERLGSSVLQLGAVANRDFLFLRGDLDARQAWDLIEELVPGMLIVNSGTASQPVYHLVAPDLFQDLLEEEYVEETRQAAAELPAVPTADACLDVEDAPDRLVVLDGEDLIGYYDVDLTLRGPYRGWSPTDEAPEAAARVLAAELSPVIPAGETASLLVFLAHPDFHPGSGLPIALPVGTVVDLCLRTTGAIQVEGKREGSLVVTEEAESLPIRFRLRADDREGEGSVEVLAFLRESCLGRLRLPVTIGAASLPETAPRQYARHIVFEPTQTPDLTLTIYENGNPLRPEIAFRLWSADRSVKVRTFGPVALKRAPEKYFEWFFDDIRALTSSTDSSILRVEEGLRRRGAGLFRDLFPAELQTLLWSHRKSIRTIRIESNEPWIPWELCRLVGREEGRFKESGFFCEEFEMGRWILDVRQRTSLRIRRLGSLAPVSDLRLKNQKEVDAVTKILRQASVGVEAISCNALSLFAALKSGVFDAFHFAGHGLHGDSSHSPRIELDGSDALTPQELTGEMANLGQSGPLVFLNACQTGRTSLSLTGMGGWAPQFLKSGAGAFLGTLWSVDTKSAAAFACAFYEALFDNRTIGAAVREARLAVRREVPESADWLAYTLFANPLLRVEQKAVGEGEVG